MELRDLHCFATLAEELSFTRTAARLRVAQPQVSIRIRQLEAELGVALFERTKRRVTLTEAGNTLLPMARRILHSTHTAVETMRMMAGSEAGTVAVGAIHSSVYTILPRIIQRFSTDYPQVNVRVEGTVDERQVAMLRDGRIDVGLLRMDHPLPDIDSAELFREEFMLAIDPGHRFARRKRVGLADIALDKLIVFGSVFSADYSAAVRSVFAERGLTPNIVREADSMLLMLGLVSAGLGVALVPASLALIHQPGIVFRPLSERLPRLSVRIAWHKDVTSPLIAKFVDVALAVSRANLLELRGIAGGDGL